MKKIIVFSAICIVLITAYITRPDDKTCIIKGVKAVWGDIVPDPFISLRFYEEFMNLNSKTIEVKDWIFFKQVIYETEVDKKTVGLGAFGHVFAIVKPVQIKR